SPSWRGHLTPDTQKGIRANFPRRNSNIQTRDNSLQPPCGIWNRTVVKHFISIDRGDSPCEMCSFLCSVTNHDNLFQGIFIMFEHHIDVITVGSDLLRLISQNRESKYSTRR